MNPEEEDTYQEGLLVANWTHIKINEITTTKTTITTTTNQILAAISTQDLSHKHFRKKTALNCLPTLRFCHLTQPLQRSFWEVMNMLIGFIVVIISHYINITNHHIVHLKYIQFYSSRFIYTSIELGGKW